MHNYPSNASTVSAVSGNNRMAALWMEKTGFLLISQSQPVEDRWRLEKQQLRTQDRRATCLDGLWADIQRVWSQTNRGTADRMILGNI